MQNNCKTKYYTVLYRHFADTGPEHRKEKIRPPRTKNNKYTIYILYVSGSDDFVGHFSAAFRAYIVVFLIEHTLE